MLTNQFADLAEITRQPYVHLRKPKDAQPRQTKRCLALPNKKKQSTLPNEESQFANPTEVSSPTWTNLMIRKPSPPSTAKASHIWNLKESKFTKINKANKRRPTLPWLTKTSFLCQLNKLLLPIKPYSSMIGRQLSKLNKSGCSSPRSL